MILEQKLSNDTKKTVNRIEQIHCTLALINEVVISLRHLKFDSDIMTKYYIAVIEPMVAGFIDAVRTRQLSSIQVALVFMGQLRGLSYAFGSNVLPAAGVMDNTTQLKLAEVYKTLEKELPRLVMYLQLPDIQLEALELTEKVVAEAGLSDKIIVSDVLTYSLGEAEGRIKFVEIASTNGDNVLVRDEDGTHVVKNIRIHIVNGIPKFFSGDLSRKEQI